jgi:SAM-dependent methyltransferase
MAHPEQREFFEQVKAEFPDWFTGSVLEIGSLNINGTVRDFFDATEYVGVDVSAGEGVDVVARGQELDYADSSFDVAVSAECFEHNPYWFETFENMVRMARKGVVFTCASTGRAEHGTSATTPSDSPFTLEWDYYRNLTEEDFAEFDFTVFDSYTFEYNPVSCDLYFVGVLPVQ